MVFSSDLNKALGVFPWGFSVFCSSAFFRRRDRFVGKCQRNGLALHHEIYGFLFRIALDAQNTARFCRFFVINFPSGSFIDAQNRHLEPCRGILL